MKTILTIVNQTVGFTNEESNPIITTPGLIFG